MNKTDFYEELGTQINEILRLHGLSKTQVANELGIYRQLFTHYITGEVKFPVLELFKLSKMLNIDLNSLIPQIQNDYHVKKVEEKENLKIEQLNV